MFKLGTHGFGIQDDVFCGSLYVEHSMDMELRGHGNLSDFTYRDDNPDSN
jgi:hypothetical protein